MLRHLRHYRTLVGPFGNGYKTFSTGKKSLAEDLAPFLGTNDSGTSQRRVIVSDDDVYDLVVVGGGSGGLSCAKTAADLGASVACIDYVDPSPQGTKWGLGGTCVNVGCIPKKLFHHAGNIGKILEQEASAYGWGATKGGDSPRYQNNWEKLRTEVQSHVRSLNWGYRTQLVQNEVDYINGKARFLDSNSVSVSFENGKKPERIRGRNFVIAVGGRPFVPDIPGAVEHGITSDDLFSLEQSPGRTIVVGGSYVALESAGFLAQLGHPVTLMVRSELLRGFDRQMAELVGKSLERRGVSIQYGCSPSSIERVSTSNGRSELLVQYSTGDDGGVETASVDTLLWATGRRPSVHRLGLDECGVHLHKHSGKIDVGYDDQTSEKNIYAIGDVAHGHPELTPIAIKSGRLLAERLFGFQSRLMDYTMIPTTVYTPLEYACCGHSEEEAIRALGEGGIEVYHSFFQPVEWSVPHYPSNECYVKVIAERRGWGRVLGLHMLAPNAGEVMQGFGVAMLNGLRFADLKAAPGIHPSIAEEFVRVEITKRSGENPEKTSC